MAAAIAALAGIATFIALMWTLVVQIFFPAQYLGNVALQIFNPVKDVRFTARAVVTAPTPQPRARHRFQDIAEDTMRVPAGIGSRS